MLSRTTELLQRPSVIGSWFDIEDAEALAESEPTRVLDDLSWLVDQHLVEVTPDGSAARFELLSSIREFARDELMASGFLEDAERTWTAWMAARARSAALHLNMDSPDDSRAWLEQAHDQLFHALGVCLSARRVVNVKALDIFNGLAPTWINRPLGAAYRRLIERTVELAENDGRKIAALSEAWAWSALLQMHVLSPGCLGSFLERLRHAQEPARSIGDDDRLLHALLCGVRVAPMTGGLEAIREVISRGPALVSSAGGHVLAGPF